MKILPLLIFVACVSSAALAQEEDRPAPAPARGLLKRGPLSKGKPTTTTTTPAPQEDAEYDEEDYGAEEAQDPSTEAPTSTTESKKLVGNGVRPFRSNTDLLAILKKKRAEAAEAKLNGPSTTTSSPAQDSLDPTKVSYNAKSKKRFNNAPVTREVANEEAPAPPPKPSRGRFGRPATRSVQEPEEEQQSEVAAPARSSRIFRRGGN